MLTTHVLAVPEHAPPQRNRPAPPAAIVSVTLAPGVKSADVEHDDPVHEMPAGDDETDCDAGPNELMTNVSVGSAVHVPPMQTELAPHGVLLGAVGFEQPAGFVHVPARWHASCAPHETAEPALHVPWTQVSGP